MLYCFKDFKPQGDHKKMQYTTTCQSPLGPILLACDDAGLTGLWFYEQKYYASQLSPDHLERETPILDAARQWLDIYFSGKEPDFMPPLHTIGSPFQLRVWKVLQEIPYGTTTTYGKIAKMIAKETGMTHMSARAAGNAIAHNKISIIIPCHRVVGSNGSLTGYAGGIEKKIRLLTLEGVNTEIFSIPPGTTS